MSASLVGSEMCIRDSLSTHPGGCGNVVGGAHVCFHQRTSRAVPSRHTCPVSYTHLTLPTICSV
eukprot:3684864-Alexandrium_andersonii.AAC.1